MVNENDSADGAPDPAGPQKTISGSLLGSATDVDTPHSSLTVQPGTVSNASGSITFQTDGDFTYHPTAGFTGNAVFNYTLNDNDVLGNAHRHWPDLPSTSRRQRSGMSLQHRQRRHRRRHLGKPFASLAPLSTGGTTDSPDGANDIIFIYGGTYSGGIVLENGQQLIGQSQGLTVNGTALEVATGSNSVINGAVMLANDNTIDGIDFGNSWLVLGSRTVRQQRRQRHVNTARSITPPAAP